MKKILQISSLTLLSFCASTKMAKELSKEGAKVALIESKPEGCEAKGKVEFTIGAKTEAERDLYISNMLRNKAAKKNANKARLNRIDQIIQQGATITFGYTYYKVQGYLYNCP